MGETTEKLAEWANTFNNWDWPNDFPVSKPEDWDDLKRWDEDPSVRTKYSLTKGYLGIVEHKEFLRWAHLHRQPPIKNWQFEVWWFVGLVNIWMRDHGIFPNFHMDAYNWMGIKWL